jgi:hypothetical protein
MKLNSKDMAQLRSKMSKLKGISGKELATELGRFALVTPREMKKVAPVDTGNLRNRIFGVARNKTAYIVANAPYSGFVEFSGKKPRRTGTIPFFYPTVNRNVKTLIDRINKRIKKALR